MPFVLIATDNQGNKFLQYPLHDKITQAATNAGFTLENDHTISSIEVAWCTGIDPMDGHIVNKVSINTLQRKI